MTVFLPFSNIEARTHGVGYYGFSQDEQERAKQQEALKKLRQETEHKQKKAQELKAMREKQLGARIKAAKNRRRARLGLPPEEEEPEPVAEPEVLEKDEGKEDVIKQKEEETERLLEKARKSHVRPWDIGKEGVKVHYEMSQEEWVEKKRTERPEEFAPPSLYRKEFRSIVKNPEVEDSDRSLKFTTKKLNKKNYFNSDSRKMQRGSLNPYKSADHSGLNPDESEDSEDISENELNEDRKERLVSPFVDTYKRKYFEKVHHNAPMQPTPIIDLCEETDFDDCLLDDYNKVMQNINEEITKDNICSESSGDGNRGKGVEIAPPPTFDYYGPSYGKRPKTTPPPVTNIQDSIEAGLRFLRKQVEEKEKSTKHPREMYLS